MTYDETSGYFHPSVIQLLNQMEKQGVRWCTNSGRNLRDQKAILEQSISRGLKHLPDALLCSESYMYERVDNQYIPAEPWNREALAFSHRFHRRIQARLLPQLADWSETFPLIRTYLQDEATVLLVSDEQAAPSLVMTRLAGLVKDLPDGQVTRNGGWVVALPAALGKGGVLRSYLHAHHIQASTVLAVGDHLNDLSMLDGSAAGHVGCPADAEPTVVAAVEAAGGVVAQSDGPLGTIEVMQHYLKNTI